MGGRNAYVSSKKDGRDKDAARPRKTEGEIDRGRGRQRES